MTRKPKRVSETGKSGAKVNESSALDISPSIGDDRYNRLLEILPDAVAIHCEGVIVFVNPAAVKLIGAGKPEDLLGKTVIRSAKAICGLKVGGTCSAKRSLTLSTLMKGNM